MSKKKTYGLVLDLPGCPPVWHSIPGAGLFHPTIATPVGESVPGRAEVSLDQAKVWDKNPGMHLKLVEVDPEKAPELRDAAADARKAEQRGAPIEEE